MPLLAYDSTVAVKSVLGGISAVILTTVAWYSDTVLMMRWAMKSAYD